MAGKQSVGAAKKRATQKGAAAVLPKKKAPVKVIEVALTARKAEAVKRAVPKGAAARKGATAAVQVASAPVVEKPVPQPFVAPSSSALRAFRRVSQKQRQQTKNVVRTAEFLAKPPVKGKRYTVDLRIHSPGSVGYFSSGGVDPGPALVRLSKVKGLDVIAVTDYYNASFIDPTRQAAVGSSVKIVAGVDLRCVVGSCRDVFMTGLFPETHGSKEVFDVLAELEVPSRAYGDREYSLKLPIGEVIDTVEKHAGVVIPSRLDKNPYRQLAVPVLVEKYGIRAFDLVHPENTDFFRERWPDGGFTFFSFSNANALAQIGTRVSKVKLTSPDFEGIREIVRRKV